MGGAAHCSPHVAAECRRGCAALGIGTLGRARIAARDGSVAGGLPDSLAGSVTGGRTDSVFDSSSRGSACLSAALCVLRSNRSAACAWLGLGLGLGLG